MRNLLAVVSEGGGGGGVIAPPGITNPALGNLNKNTGVSFFQQLIQKGITLVLVAGVIIFLFMLLISAIQWMTAGGDKAAVETARGRLTQAIIGIVLMFATWAVVLFIQNFFGIKILSIDITALSIK